MSHGGPDYSITTAGGSGLVMIGTTFPVTPYLDELFYRTDLELLCHWNGIYWLTENEYSASLSLVTGLAADTYYQYRVRSDYTPYLTRVSYTARVNTTNDATNYWKLRITVMSNGPWTIVSTPFNQNTSADGIGNFVEHEAYVNVKCDTTIRWLATYLTKTSAPGTLDVGCTFYYRLVVT